EAPRSADDSATGQEQSLPCLSGEASRLTDDSTLPQEAAATEQSLSAVSGSPQDGVVEEGGEAEKRTHCEAGTAQGDSGQVTEDAPGVQALADVCGTGEAPDLSHTDQSGLESRNDIDDILLGDGSLSFDVSDFVPDAAGNDTDSDGNGDELDVEVEERKSDKPEN
ncbi:hypothetical protein EGW08_014376, partial [Elysia chlorotica]